MTGHRGGALSVAGLLLVFAVLALMACEPRPQGVDVIAKPVLPAAEVASLERRASAGDREALLRLAMHYEFASGGTPDSRQRAEHWIELAAETGDAAAIDRWAAWLLVTKRCDEARSWFDRLPSTAEDRASFERDELLCRRSAQRAP